MNRPHNAEPEQNGISPATGATAPEGAASVRHSPIAAAARVRKFLEERARMRSLYQAEIASVHVGDPDREAVLFRDDLWALVRMAEGEC